MDTSGPSTQSVHSGEARGKMHDSITTPGALGRWFNVSCETKSCLARVFSISEMFVNF